MLTLYIALFQLNGKAFEVLQIDEQNYKNVQHLTLDNNMLESLPAKLLKMSLKLGFSAKSNKLTSVSYQRFHTYNYSA